MSCEDGRWPLSPGSLAKNRARVFGMPYLSVILFQV